GRLGFGAALRQAWLALLMPVIILGGIYGGIFTPTEASAVAVMYALAVALFVYRSLTLRDLSKVLHRTVVSTAVIMFIIANTGVFGYLLNRAGIPAALGASLRESLHSHVSFLLHVNAALVRRHIIVETAAS